MESVNKAIELGWYPEFWVGDTARRPICDCRRNTWSPNTNGEFVLKPDYAVPLSALRSASLKCKNEKRDNCVVKPKVRLAETVFLPLLVR